MGLDLNTLRRLLTQYDETGMSDAAYSPSAPNQNALLASLAAKPVYTSDQEAFAGLPEDQRAAAKLPMGSMRNEQTGKVTYFNPGGAGFSDSPYAGTEAATAASSAPQQMRKVYGAGNGTTAELAPEAATAPVIDYSRAPIDIPGVGRGFYGKDGNVYGKGADGQPFRAILGYDMQGSMALNAADLKRREGEAQIAHTAEQIRASQVQNPDMGSMTSGAGPATTGDSLLQSLDPGTAGLVKAYADGRIAFPGGAAMRSPRMMQLLSLVSAYDPTFDATDFNARNKTLSGFTAGRQGDAVRAVNQAIAHAGSLNDSIDKLGNFNGMGTALNAPVNWAQQNLGGDVRQGEFKQNAVALASELRKVFAGSGGGSLSELQSWESGLPLNASQEQQHAYLRKGLDLLQGAIGALNDQYTRGMGPRANVMDIISPKAKETLERLQGGGSAAPAAQATTSSIPAGAVAKLKSNPGLRVAFDMKYGQGSAAQVLGQ